MTVTDTIQPKQTYVASSCSGGCTTNGPPVTQLSWSLVTQQPNSPHLQAAKTKAQFLIAIAESDDKPRPMEKDVLKKTFEDAKLPAEIEVYGAAHGWCPPDSTVYNEPLAEKAWGRLLALYGKALA